jgi:hypothetical protein
MHQGGGDGVDLKVVHCVEGRFDCIGLVSSRDTTERRKRTPCTRSIAFRLRQCVHISTSRHTTINIRACSWPLLFSRSAVRISSSTPYSSSVTNVEPTSSIACSAFCAVSEVDFSCSPVVDDGDSFETGAASVSTTAVSTRLCFVLTRHRPKTDAKLGRLTQIYMKILGTTVEDRDVQRLMAQGMSVGTYALMAATGLGTLGVDTGYGGTHLPAC